MKLVNVFLSNTSTTHIKFINRLLQRKITDRPPHVKSLASLETTGNYHYRTEADQADANYTMSSNQADQILAKMFHRHVTQTQAETSKSV